MAIMRNGTQQFTVVAQAIMRDERLSLKDTGLLVRLLSLPDNWEFSENGLMQIFKQDGQASIRTGLKNLEECGYLTRKRTRNSAGQLTNVEWTIYDYPHLENPNLDKPQLDNRPQSNTKESITNESSNDSKKVSKKGGRVESFDSIIDAYTQDEELGNALREFIKMRQRIRKPLTNYALSLLMKKLDKLANSAKVKVAVLNQSIENSWQNVYPLKNSGNSQQANDERFYGKNANEAIGASFNFDFD